MNHVQPNKKQKKHHKQSYSVHVKGEGAVRLMERLRPLMGGRRKKQIDRALNSWDGKRRRRLGDDAVRKIRRRLAKGEPCRTIATAFGISRPLVQQIKQNKIYAG